ncbi:MAG TPA: hypothetical protein VK436_02090 [Methanocella sp.]|nr:hypothetical protein [Methanocella sp.]
MGVDYLIDHPCKVKDTLSGDRMIAMIKQRNRGLAIINLMATDGMSEADALNSMIKVQALDGTHQEMRKVSEVLHDTSCLDQLQVNCKSCPASHGEPFGCYRWISYPLSAKAEDWLAYLSKKSAVKGPPRSKSLIFIQEQELDGGRVTGMRTSGPEYFEIRKPRKIVVGGTPFNLKYVNTDQVLNLLFGFERVKSAHALMLLHLSGGLTLQDKEPARGSYEFLTKKTDETGEIKWFVYNLPEAPSDDLSTRNLKEYFKAIFIAYKLDDDLLVNLVS